MFALTQATSGVAGSVGLPENAKSAIDPPFLAMVFYNAFSISIENRNGVFNDYYWNSPQEAGKKRRYYRDPLIIAMHKNDF